MRLLGRWLRRHDTDERELRLRSLRRRFEAVSRAHERSTRHRGPRRWGKLIAIAFVAAGLVAGVSPWLPFPPTIAAAEQIIGHARVIDGDTLEVRGTRIRLHGIDAPELQQQCRREGASAALTYPCGQEAKAALVYRH